MLLPNAYFISEMIGQLSERGSTVVRKAQLNTRHGGRRVLERADGLYRVVNCGVRNCYSHNFVETAVEVE